MTRTTCEPAYRSKHLYTLLWSGRSEYAEMLESYQYLYALDNDMLEFVQNLAQELYRLGEGRKPLPPRYLKEWYEGRA